MGDNRVIKMSLSNLRSLLILQKRIVTENLLTGSYRCNTESNAGEMKSLSIDKDKFNEIGMSSKFVDDYNVLERYLKDE